MISRKHDSSCGELLYKKKKFRVLERPLPEDLINKYCKYSKKPNTFIEEFWMFHRCKWEIRKNELYLTEMFQTHFLKKLTSQDYIIAIWVDSLLLHRATEVLLSSKKYSREEKLYYSRLKFRKGKLLTQELNITSSCISEVNREINLMGIQYGIYTFYIKDIILKGKHVIIDGNDNLIPYLEKDIKDMIKNSTKNTELKIKDFSRVLKKLSKITYIGYEVCSSKDRQKMLDTINDIVDKIDVIINKIPVKCLVFIEVDEDFNLEVVKIFIENLYQLYSYDSTIIVGINNVKKLKLSKNKKHYISEENEEVPYMTCQIIIGKRMHTLSQEESENNSCSIVA